MTTHILMARFNAWANERLYSVAGDLSDEDYFGEKGAFFGSIHRTLNHILLVDILWRARLEGWKPEGIRSLDQVLHDAFEDLRAQRRIEDAALISYCESLGAESGGEEVAFTTLSGKGDMTLTRDQILVTLFNHQTHHRGQIHCLLTQVGVVPPPLDVPNYLYRSA